LTKIDKRTIRSAGGGRSSPLEKMRFTKVTFGEGVAEVELQVLRRKLEGQTESVGNKKVNWK